MMFSLAAAAAAPAAVVMFCTFCVPSGFTLLISSYLFVLT